MTSPITHQEVDTCVEYAYQIAVTVNQTTGAGNLPHIHGNLDFLRQTLNKADLENLSTAKTLHLRYILRTKLPKRVRKITKLYAAGRVDFFSGISAHDYTRIYLYHRYAKKLVNTERYHRVRSQLKTIPAAVPPANTQKIGTGLTQQFPNLDFCDNDLNMQLQTLRANWQRARQLPSHTSEDRFLLEQIAISYLPDSWAMHKDATAAPGVATARANTLIRDQLETLNSRILEILGRSSDTALNRLEAQTNFIKQKQVTPKPGRLHVG